MTSDRTAPPYTEQLQVNFQKILAERQLGDRAMGQKQAAVEQAKNQQTLAAASAYTVKSIVKGLADLQIECVEILNGLSTQLSTQVSKLDELDRAIALENQHLQTLQQVRVVADVLHLQTQNHQVAIQTLEQQASERQQALAQTMEHHRQDWAKEQSGFEQRVQEATRQRQAEREREESDYAYERERTRTIEDNDYHGKKRAQEQELREQSQIKEQDWQDREQTLVTLQPLQEDYQHQVAQFAAELEAALQTVTREAIATLERDAQVQSALLAKEWEATHQSYEVKIQALHHTIQAQTLQLEQLQHQLNETLQQSQALTLKAFDRSAQIQRRGIDD